MNENEFAKLKNEIANLKKVIAYQAITAAGPLKSKYLLDFLKSAGFDEYEIEILLNATWGTKYKDKVMSGNQ
jgi:hypothetical protein